VAAGDMNEDGTDDVVAVWRGTGGFSLGMFAGPDLAQVASAALSGIVSAAAVSMADVDGDGHLEVFEAATGDGLSFVVRALDRALQPRWETRTELAMDGSLAYPAGGPVVADLEGDGSLSVLVSTGRDVLALDARAGTVRWRMLEANPSFDGRLVTGFAAEDGDGDDRAEWPWGSACQVRRPAENRPSRCVRRGPLVAGLDEPRSGQSGPDAIGPDRSRRDS
jgi:hypothetical protein